MQTTAYCSIPSFCCPHDCCSQTFLKSSPETPVIKTLISWACKCCSMTDWNIVWLLWGVLAKGQDHHGLYLQEMKVVLRQGQLGEHGAPLPKLPYLLLQLLKESLSLVLSCSTVHLNHLGKAQCGLWTTQPRTRTHMETDRSGCILPLGRQLGSAPH